MVDQGALLVVLRPRRPDEGRGVHPVRRQRLVGAFPFELGLLAACVVAWAVALLALGGVIDLAGLLHLDLYRFYALAAGLGWLAGNVWVHRSRGLPKPIGRRLAFIYVLGTPGFLYLVRAMAPAAAQAAAPLAPVYSYGVFGILFLVPVTLRRR